MEKLNLSTKQHLMGMYHVMCYDINVYNYHCPPTHKPNNINHLKWGVNSKLPQLFMIKNIYLMHSQTP